MLRIFTHQADAFTAAADSLRNTVDALTSDSTSSSWLRARKALEECRLSYKRIAFFTAYFFPSETAIYNAPARFEVEDTELELIEPMGLQQIEALLFDAHANNRIAALRQQADAVYSSARDLKSLLYRFTATDAQVMESLRLEVIRIQTLYITGYDAPMLKTGIRETLEASNTIRAVLKPYLQQFAGHGDELSNCLNNSIDYLSHHTSFDSFDRMEYLLHYAIPLQQALNGFIADAGLSQNTAPMLNYGAGSSFHPGFVRIADTSRYAQDPRLKTLGQQLFSDKRLSLNAQVSCATCHRPDHFFADGLPRSAALRADTILRRNTPTLFYSGMQHFQFWDGRAPRLGDQVRDVLFNPIEMGAQPDLLVKLVRQADPYRQTFDSIFPDSHTTDQQVNDLVVALSAFVNTLNPMRSAFDGYMNGDRNAMNAEQVRGFNLFMGKAQCGTCHFAPYFNALLPPYYNISEVEILGTPATDQLDVASVDTDPGRYERYHVRYYKQAFKTPTVRNAARTAPYMHNGAFHTLEGVLDFYNKGGGNGIGLHIPDQTLASTPLDLSKTEINDIIAFIGSLTDTIPGGNFISN